MSADSTEKRVPYSVVFMTVGVIFIITALALFLMLPWGSKSVAQAPPSSALAAAPTAVDTVLMPASPEEEAAPAATVTPSVSPVPTGMIGLPLEIEIPTISLRADVVTVGLQPVRIGGENHYQWQVPDSFNAGWHNDSAPLGSGGNTVLNGHHNIYGEVFGDLVELNETDAIILTDDQGFRYTFRVDRIEILPEQGQPLAVRVENARWINPTPDERLTLVTCWPPEDNTHRLIVVAFPDDAEASVQPMEE